MKLKLEHLAPYLPYSVQCLCYDGEDDREPIDLWYCVSSYYSPNKIKRGLDPLMGSTWKPILRPLSDLAKEIEHNGKKFVPLFVLNQMRGVTSPIKDYKFERNDSGSYQGIDTSKTHECFWGHNTFWFEEETISFYDNSKAGISPQLEMFQKLFKWHFDVFGLIKNGLAIDINTLKK